MDDANCFVNIKVTILHKTVPRLTLDKRLNVPVGTHRTITFFRSSATLSSGLACLGMAIIDLGGTVTTQSLEVDFPFDNPELTIPEFLEVANSLGLAAIDISNFQYSDLPSVVTLVIYTYLGKFLNINRLDTEKYLIRDPIEGCGVSDGFPVDAESIDRIFAVHPTENLRKERENFAPSVFCSITDKTISFPAALEIEKISDLDEKFGNEITAYFHSCSVRSAHEQYKKLVAARTLCVSDSTFFGDERDIRYIHRFIYDNVVSHAGQYRDVELARNRVFFVSYTEIERSLNMVIPHLLESLAKVRSDTRSSDVARFFSDLNVIHPFFDGNGTAIFCLIRKALEKQGFSLATPEKAKTSFYAAAYHARCGDISALKAIFDNLISIKE